MDTEIVIVGGGVMGLSCAWRLAAAGRSVVLLERFRFGHDGGSSHGPTRIFRYVYDHPRYVAMARAALSLWRELEQSPGELLRICGGMDAGDPVALRRCADALRAEGERFEWLATDAIRERYPWCRLPGPVLVSPDTGVIDAQATLHRLRARATDAGAELIEERPVTVLEPDQNGVTIRTDAGDVRARTVVVTAGAWTARLIARFGLVLPVRVTDEQVFYVDGPPRTVPVIWRKEQFFYTVPSFDGSGTIKIGEHVGGRQVDPDRREEALPPAEHLAAWARNVLPSFSEPGTRGDRCLYTITPDEDFVLDRRGVVIVVSACSGHGFKFAPLIGQAVERIVGGAAVPFPLGPFSLSRF